MVTYINVDNAEKYTALFEEAAAALLSDAMLKSELELEEDFSIGSLNEYYAYLEKLMKLNINEEDEDSETRRNLIAHFARVPLDEDFFKINANSRTITVPSTSFGRYGVGVQGDVLAEVVYFTIDRYFDSTDLAGSDIHIAIQWEARDENKNLIAGLSKNFGKDIAMIDGHPSIIFGWPISPELTAAAGKIKFAVRFYKFSNENESGTKTLVYNFNTLPAEVSINASLNYDIINDSTLKEVDYGKVITGRIKSNGIYDPNAEIPSAPTLTTKLFIRYPDDIPEGAKVVDLQDNGDPVQLAIGAKKTDWGTLQYEWHRYEYSNGEYETDSATTLTENIRYIYVPVDTSEDIHNTTQEYYTGTEYVNETLTKATLVLSDELDHIVARNGEFYHDYDDSSINLYKRLSVASVNKVGEYAVDVTARKGVNSSTRTMPQSERIRIPGPQKPVISLPEETENISVTQEDQIVHAIADENHSVTLVVNAQEGEVGKPSSEVGENPNVSLTYSWKKVNTDGTTSQLLEPPAMSVSVVPISHLPEDPSWRANTEEDDIPGYKGEFNQENVTISQDGNVVNIYLHDELKEYLSTNPSQGIHQWVALDIDTGEESLEGVTWNDYAHDVYTFTAEDDNDLDVGYGHIVFWIKIDEALHHDTVKRDVNDVTLTFNAYEVGSTGIHYSTSGNSLVIDDIPEGNVDQRYVCEVTATRNNVTATDFSGEYRVTNAPEKPVLSFQGNPINNNLVPSRLMDDRGEYYSLSFETDNSIPSDKIIYLWIHANIDDEGDSQGNYIVPHVDLGGALSDILGQDTNLGGTPDQPCDASVAYYDQSGNLVLTGETGTPEYLLNQDSQGVYYCIVINELNNKRAASVGPFFSINR